MPRGGSPKRYALAVFQIALENDQLEHWREDLTFLASSFQDDEVVGVLDAPQVPASTKTNVVRESLGDSVSPLAVNLISILALKSLVHIIPDILDEYSLFLDAHGGVERAEVLSAIPLDDALEERIVELLEGIVGKTIRLASVVEPEILGGLVARVGDRVIDGSVRTKLAEMRKDLSQAGS